MGSVSWGGVGLLNIHQTLAPVSLPLTSTEMSCLVFTFFNSVKCILSIITSPSVVEGLVFLCLCVSLSPQLHAEIVLLKCKVKELEAAASDAGYFAMMYHVSADSGEGSKEAEPVKT